MRKQECPIGFECIHDGSRCLNYFQCKDLTTSWEIPYRIQDGALIVRPYGWRCNWDDQARGTELRYCQLPSGDYQRLDGTEHEYEMKARLVKSWAEEGWVAAEPLFGDGIE